MDVFEAEKKYIFSGETVLVDVNFGPTKGIRPCKIHFYTEKEVNDNQSIWELIVEE